jgi:hypothetical protein
MFCMMTEGCEEEFEFGGIDVRSREKGLGYVSTWLDVDEVFIVIAVIVIGLGDAPGISYQYQKCFWNI